MKSLESKYNQIVKSKGAIGNFQLVTCLLLTVLFGQSFAQRGPFSNSEQVLLNKFNHSEAHELLFLENRGQITNQKGKVRKDVLFMARGNGGFKVVVKGNGLSYQFYKTDRKVDLGDRKEMLLDPTKFEDEKFNEETYRVDMHLVGANPKPTIQRLKENGYTESYYNLAHAPEGIHGVKSYEKIVLKDVYPGIDWVIYSQGKGLKYDFIVHPGADFKQIKMRYEGSSALRLQKDGSLLVKSPLGELTEDAPITFSGNKEVKSSFTLENGLLSFDVPNFDAKQTLTIDPTLLWGTYYGGSASDVGNEVRVDGSGNVYIGGTTASTNNIATAGAHQTVYGGGTTDGFIVKFDANGNRLWGTYYGGTGNNDQLFGLAIDASGNVFATGGTLSATGIATVGSHQPSWAGSGNNDAYLVKFNSSGVRQWGTYYGSTPSDLGLSVGVDGSGNVYMAGQTGSLTAIATAGTHQTALAGGTSTDAFLVKFNTDGVRQWGTYYGGTLGESASALNIDAAGNIYLTGSAFSTAGIATIHQTTAGGAGDAFIVKFNTNGIRQWGTYYGGTGFDSGYGIAVDAAGNVFVAGSTASAGGTSIATAGSFQTANGGGTDGFLVRFNTTGTRQWGTYIGGPGTDILNDISLDATSSSLVLIGETASTTNIASAGAYQTTFGGGTQDVYFARFNQTGTRQWSSYFGGAGLDVGNGIVFSAGSMYMTGRTTSTSRISTTGAHQTSFAGGTDDAFLVKISPLTVNGLAINASTCSTSDGQINLTVTDGTAPYTFLWSDGATTQNRTGLAEGTYTVTVTDNLGVSVEQSFTVLSPPIITNGQPAKDLLGQYTTTSGFVNNWTQDGSNNNNGSGVVYELGFLNPRDLVIDEVNHRLFVSDRDNHRVLVFNLDTNNKLIDKTPDFVLGQANFTSKTAATTQAGMNGPGALFYDATRQFLFVAQGPANRITVYDVSTITNGENAINVLGQSTFTGSTAATSTTGMSNPQGMAYDAARQLLFVAGAGNHRVTVYDLATITNGEAAINVLGQSTFTASTAATTAAGMSSPQGLAFDPGKNLLYVSQAGNHRVTVFDVASITNGEAAISVLGQLDFTSSTAADTQSKLNTPRGVFLDAGIQRLFVADVNNNRVMVFDVASITNGENAINVLGQPLFTGSTPGTTQSKLASPEGLYFNATSSELYVTEADNNRVIIFGLGVAVTGVVTPASCGANGAINITVTGGTAPYTYNWGGGITTEDRTNIAAGTYNVTVTDACGQTGTASFTVASITTYDITSSKAQYRTDSPSLNYASCPEISVTMALTPGFTEYAYTSFIQFDLSGIPVGSTIPNATLRLVKQGGAGASLIVNINRITQSWTEGTGCALEDGTLHPNTTAPVVATFTANPADPNGTVYTVNITSLVQDWVNGTVPNYGISLDNVDQSLYKIISFHSDDATDPTVRPRLLIDAPALPISVTGTVTPSTCGANGAINITATGGTAPYTYNWGGGVTSEDRTNIVPGNYTVTVTDACGQVAVQSFTVAGSSQPTATATFTNINCFGANNGSITISGQTGGSGTYEYRLNTGAWQSSPSFTGLAPGSYLVQIRDAGNPTCESVISTLEITQPASFSANGFVTPVNCFGGSTGSIIQTITGGVAPFTYVWSGSSVTTKDRTNLPAGVYTVTITDANGCQVVRSYEVTQAPALVVTNTVTQPTCGVAGSILLSISGGIAPYTFDWADLSGGNDPQNRSNLAFGSYSVTVTDSRGCTVTQNFTLNDPGCGLGKIICIAGNTADQYSVTPDATIESYTWTVPTGAVIVSGQGTPSIVINWTGATPGPGQICVKTINDCGESQNYCEPVLLKLVNATASSTFACSGGSLQLFGNGGTEYSWTGPNGFTSNLQNPVIYNASTLASGVYTVTVTDEDGCSSVATVNVVVQPGFTLTENIQPATCGLTNGEIDLIITGGTAPFTYAWSNGANTEDLINLPAGIYTVKVTDANGCVVELTGAVGDVEGPSLTASVQNIICNGQFTGSIDLTVLSGTAPYTFLWSNGATTEDISGLRAGVYSVVVVDANGCVATLTQVVNQPNPVQVSAVRVNASCFGTNTGRITLTVSGGTPGFTYSWSDGGPAVSDRTNLAAGSYTVTITDAAGCTTVRTYIISQPNPIIATPTVKNILCAADTNGIISVAVTGGALPLSYSWTGPGGFTATTKDILNLKPGDYTLVITDANGCTATLTRTVTAPAVLAATTAVTPVSCFGTATGSVTLTVTGGTAPFTYLWSNGATTQSLSGVRAGVYAVLITDANGCIATASGVVASPSQLLVGFTKQDVTCFGGTTGQISVSPTGGTGAYTYTWSDGGSTSATRTGLAAGNYTVTVTDANGCTATELITITSNPEILVNSTIGDVNCFGGNNGSITLSTGGGTGTLTYAWADGPTTKDRTNLTAGTYSVTITDALGCSVNRTFTITQPAVLAATGTVQNVLCNGADNGAINLTVTGGVAPFTYAWSSGQSSQNVTGLAPGSYSVVVTDFNLCSVTQSFSVTEPDSIVVLSTVTPNCFGQTNGTIALSVSGGTAPYTYAWTGAGTGTSARFGLGTGTYTVTITDANGCIYTETFVVEPLQVTLSSEAITCRTNDGTITAVVTGGLEPYAFLWSNGATTEDISQLAPGTYSVTVTAGFCTATASVVLAAPTGCLPPTAQSESFTTPFNTPITQTATPTDSLAQGYDSDPVFDLSELIFEEFYGAPDSVGVIVFGPQGDFTFTPAPNFIGSFTWEYTICNIRNACDTAALTITVLPNPILATNDTYGPIVGKTGNSNVGNVLSNDSLAALPATLSTVTLSTVIAEPTGKVTLNPDGTVSVAANTPADTFQLTYRICEILIPTNCDTAVVSVIVTPAPIDAVNDVSTATIEETIGGVAIPDVRTNDRLNNLPIVNADVTIAQEGVWPAGITLNTTTGAVSVAPSVVSGPYSMQYKLCEVLNPTNCDIATVSLVVSIPPYVKLFPRVYLQGSLYGVSMPDTLMRDNLRTLNRLPLSHPYSYLSPITPVAAVNPAVFTVAGANAIVDWVFVELRSKADSTVIVDSRAALLQRDGDIVDIDGTSAVQFGTATNTQQYFVAVRHRNHLGVMTASALTMTPAGLLVDFRKATTPTFRFTTAALNQSQVIVQQGRAMWAGNTARDRQIIYQGTQNDVNPVYNRVLSDVGNVFLLPTFKSRGYQQEDVDMNGESVFQGTGNDLEFIYQNIISNHIGNAFVLPFFTIREQLP